jgi:hypothetical protein
MQEEAHASEMAVLQEAADQAHLEAGACTSHRAPMSSTSGFEMSELIMLMRIHSPPRIPVKRGPEGNH